MPKLKTHKGAAKRFSVTGTGKVKRRKAFHSHILASKSPKRKRKLRMGTMLDATNAKAIKRLIMA